MANLTLTSDTIALVNQDTANGLQITSGNALITMPIINSVGATSNAPQVLGVEVDAGPFTWLPLNGTGTSNIPITVMKSITATNAAVTIPTGLANPISAKITLIGGGGGGGNVPDSGNFNRGAGGGGAGGTSIIYLNDIQPDQTFNVAIGGGGAGAAGPSNSVGGTGGDSTLAWSGAITPITYTSSGGGGGGSGNNADYGTTPSGFGGSGDSNNYSNVISIGGNSGNPGSMFAGETNGPVAYGANGGASFIGGCLIGGQNPHSGSNGQSPGSIGSPNYPYGCGGGGANGTQSNGGTDYNGGQGGNGIAIFEFFGNSAN